MNQREVFESFGFDGGTTISGVSIAGEWRPGSGGTVEIPNPTTGETMATVGVGGQADYEAAVTSAVETFQRWRTLPAPVRGDFVRRLGNALRDKRDALGALVSLEVGKILPEGIGEVQEMIDICDFAVGLSRQLYGKTMASERVDHRMYEQWHPLGPVGVITAFNFPVAVWSWNSAIAAVCGDPILWKPSERTPLTAIAVTRIANEVMAGSGYEGVFNLVAGTGDVIGESMVNDRRLPLISATGSIRMGKIVGPKVAARLGRSVLELGGNNAIVVMDDADLELAVRAALFAAVGTSGQRCTSLRRLLVHRAIVDKLVDRLKEAYAQVSIGDPLEEGTLMGPLVNQAAVDQMLAAVETARLQGATIVTGGKPIERAGFFVEPAIARIPPQADILQEETFAPILWIVEFDTLEEAIEIHNGVVQGLSSAIFTQSLKNAERFLSATGSDCGIANVNIGTSGAEIGGAFGGEKDTGGGREAGSDSWKAYMRRQTTTINWGDDLPLAQGISFG
ncbi:MAG TPA: aldehyde dehydrogenase family protein [Acidimicrobiia bacterium]|nr:aldehyde dehydrogenase family protein [Acidimicrobiia bacterium]